MTQLPLTCNPVADNPRHVYLLGHRDVPHRWVITLVEATGEVAKDLPVIQARCHELHDFERGGCTSRAITNFTYVEYLGFG